MQDDGRKPAAAGGARRASHLVLGHGRGGASHEVAVCAQRSSSGTLFTMDRFDEERADSAMGMEMDDKSIMVKKQVEITVSDVV